MTALNNAIYEAFLVLLREQGTPVINVTKSTNDNVLKFEAIVAPAYSDETRAGLRITKRAYNITLLTAVEIDFGDVLTFGGRSFVVAPREQQASGPVGLDEVAKKLRIIEK